MRPNVMVPFLIDLNAWIKAEYPRFNKTYKIYAWKSSCFSLIFSPS